MLALAVLHTWPLATDPGRVSLHSEDEWLNAWAVSWIAQQLVRDPSDLFGANMFYPTENAYAYTEPLLVPALMGAPLRWLGASPMLTYNLLLLAGLTLTGLAMYWLVVGWTGDPWAGVLAGAVLAFSTAMLTRLAHLQALHLYALPLALLALDRLVRRGRTRDAGRIGLCVLCAALTSGYLVVFVTVALGSALLVRAPELRGAHGARVLMRLAASAVVTLAALLVLLSPYLAVQGARPLSPDAPGRRDGTAQLPLDLGEPALPMVEPRRLPVAGCSVPGRDRPPAGRRGAGGEERRSARRPANAPGRGRSRRAALARSVDAGLRMGVPPHSTGPDTPRSRPLRNSGRLRGCGARGPRSGRDPRTLAFALDTDPPDHRRPGGSDRGMPGRAALLPPHRVRRADSPLAPGGRSRCAA